jgi:hypothetical protein
MDYLFDRELPITRRGKYGIPRIVLAAFAVIEDYMMRQFKRR